MSVAGIWTQKMLPRPKFSNANGEVYNSRKTVMILFKATSVINEIMVKTLNEPSGLIGASRECFYPPS